MKLNKILIRNMKMRRMELGISQQNLAKKANIGFSTIGQIEMGLKQPTLRTVDAIAKALKLDPYQLLMPNLYTL